MKQPKPVKTGQVGGNHYSKLAIQPIEYIEANKIPFTEGNIIKYITRWRDKGGFADLDKIAHLLEWLKHHNPQYAKPCKANKSRKRKAKPKKLNQKQQPSQNPPQSK